MVRLLAPQGLRDSHTTWTGFWGADQDEKLTEPNSALGSASRYMLSHWEKPTLFLRQAATPAS
jgi:hypothetical protein